MSSTETQHRRRAGNTRHKQAVTLLADAFKYRKPRLYVAKSAQSPSGLRLNVFILPISGFPMPRIYHAGIRGHICLCAHQSVSTAGERRLLGAIHLTGDI